MIRLYDYILERQSISFQGSNANYGNCIILAGGPGSGKGYAKDHRILAQFKTFDVDELKKMYIKMVEKGKIPEDHKEYDLRDPDDTTELHMKVKDRGWKKKQRKAFWDDRQKQNAKTLPNVVFDMVSDDPKDIYEVVKYAKPLGYKVSLVWVCCHIDTARAQNQNRGRRVHDAVIVKGHKGAYEVIMGLLNNKYPELNDAIDEAWITFTAGYGRMLTGEWEKNPVLKIPKDKEGNFVFKEKTLVEDFFKEQMPEDPDWDKKQKDEEERKEKVKNAKAKTDHLKAAKFDESLQLFESQDNFIYEFIREIQEELLY